MANKTLGTRQKLVFRSDTGAGLARKKPRNPLVAPALQRRAGAHRKGKGAERQAGHRLVDKLLTEIKKKPSQE